MKLLPHGDLVELAPGLWQVTGMVGRGNFPRNMVVYRIPNSGGLLLHSVIRLDDARRKALEALGKPEIMIVPSRMHRLDAADYKTLYPQLRVLCPEDARKEVEKRVAVDDICENVLPGLGITVHKPDGIKSDESVYELVLVDGAALIFTDILFNLPHLPGLDGLIVRLIGSSGFFGITPLGRWTLVRDRARYRSWLEHVAKRDDVRVICVGHGNAVTEKASERMAEAAART